MTVFAVTYDLKAPDRDYTKLHDAIKSLGSYSKRFESFWLVDCSLTAGQIRDKLKTVVDANDKILVIQVAKHWATLNVESGMINWLRDSSRTF